MRRRVPLKEVKSTTISSREHIKILKQRIPKLLKKFEEISEKWNVIDSHTAGHLVANAKDWVEIIEYKLNKGMPFDEQKIPEIYELIKKAFKFMRITPPGSRKPEKVNLYKFSNELSKHLNLILANKTKIRTSVVLNPEFNKINMNIRKASVVECIKVFVFNAVRATELAGRTSTIVIELSVEDNNFKVQVKDNGIGINDKDKGKIFNDIFTTKEKDEKNIHGKGLYGVGQNIYVVHKGKTFFESKKDKGSIFGFTIPINKLN